MRKIRCGVVVLLMLLCCSVTSAPAQVSIGIGLPNLSIGINLPIYPELVPVPSYPVYYAPRVNANYFFYDGMYWVYLDDYWYASYWYNGPWAIVQPDVVPLYILRVPVRYYRQPPVYFRGWRPDAPPRWGEHWGHGWEQRHRGWNTWSRSSAPVRAPLPAYQRQYTGDRYPQRVEQQQQLRSQHYRYQPRDKAVRQHFQQQGVPAQRGRQEEQRMRGPGPQEYQRPATHEPGGQRPQQPYQHPSPQRGPAERDQIRQPAPAQREQQAPMPRGQDQRYQERERPQEPGRGQGQGQGQGQRREEERGR